MRIRVIAENNQDREPLHTASKNKRTRYVKINIMHWRNRTNIHKRGSLSKRDRATGVVQSKAKQNKTNEGDAMWCRVLTHEGVRLIVLLDRQNAWKTRKEKKRKDNERR